MLSNLTVRQRMLGLSVLALVFVIVVSTVGYRSLQNMSAASELQSEASSALRSQMEADMMHDTLRSDVLGAVLAANKGQADDLAALNREVGEHATSFAKQMETLAGMSLSPDITTAVKKSQEQLRAYAASARTVVELAGRDLPAAEAQLPAFAKNFKLLETEMATLSDLIEAHEKATRESAAEDARQARMALLVATLLALALLLTINMWVGRGITRPLQAAVRATQAVARGDLSVTLDTRGTDETAQLLQALQTMCEQLAGMVSEVRASADAIHDGSTEIAAGSLSLSQRTEEQASSLEETSAAMETMTDTVRNNAETASAATRLASDASSGAAAGGQAVERMVSTMEQISRSSGRIADIIGVIDGIAFQTNILALNAAVEAARAGEQGRGFAVVAGEVRLLAQRSSQAAKEIKSLIEESVSQVEQGNRQVADAGSTVQAVVGQVERVAQLIAEINTAGREQTDGIVQVSSAISVLDQMTQQNAALVEETAASAESLRQQADRLAGLMHRFKLSE